jgi:predicted MFS family arabinose efflux permease
VAAIAAAPTYTVFAAAWLVAGMAMSGVLYPPAFAAVTRWYGPRRIQALTVLTVAGGLASTIFAPITAVLADRLDWRGTYLVLAMVLAAITIPAHALGLRRPWPAALRTDQQIEQPVGRIAASTPFLALAVAFALAAGASYAVVVNLVPLLTERGVGLAAAAVILGVGGIGQVLGRLGYPPLHKRLAVRVRTVVVLAGVAGCTALVAVLTSPAGLVAAVALAGVGRGMVTLLHATAVSERWATPHYAQLSSLLAAPVVISAALAPWIGSALAAALGGYGPMYAVMAGLGLAAAAVAAMSVPGSERRVRAAFGRRRSERPRFSVRERRRRRR